VTHVLVHIGAPLDQGFNDIDIAATDCADKWTAVVSNGFVYIGACLNQQFNNFCIT
jgi:hypothetical protein